MTICYDLRFPQLYRALAQAGAEILAVPAAFTKVTGEAHWHVLNRARAIENGAVVVAPCAVGAVPGGGAAYGHSLVVSPWGEVLADGGDGVGVRRHHGGRRERRDRARVGSRASCTTGSSAAPASPDAGTAPPLDGRSAGRQRDGDHGFRTATTAGPNASRLERRTPRQREWNEQFRDRALPPLAMPDPPVRHAQSRRTPIGRDDATRVHGRPQRAAPCPSHHRAVQAPRALRDDGVPPHGEAHPRSGRTARRARSSSSPKRYYQTANEFSDSLTASFPPRFRDRGGRRCWATGNAGSTSSSSVSQRFDLHCKVR